VWAALDYPYMKRYSKSFLKKHPHLKGKDIETTRKSCEKFRDIPVSVMNFVEGTRFTKEKQKKLASNYTYLLNPKAGGVAFVLSAMGEQLSSILDVTIKYDPKAVGFWDFLCGKVTRVTVRIEHIPISDEVIGDYFNDTRFKIGFHKWVNALWQKKDKTLAMLHGRHPQN
jgi:1-acyl-sn-glycerol-3-phosphate acyltransferase